jgi:hypothetical protein
MRLVELHLDADRPIDLILHARLTVVIADELAGQRIASVLGRAFVLAGSELGGTIDAGGYLTPLDPTAVVSLNLDGDGIRVLTAADLVAPDPARRAGARAAAEAERDRTELLVDAARGRLDHACRRHDATLAAVAAGQEELAASLERRDDLDTAGLSLEQRPPQLEREHAAAVAALEAARARIGELRSVRDELVPALGEGGVAAHLRMGDDTSALAALVERAAAVGGISPAVHHDLIEWLGAVSAGTAPVHPEADALVRGSAEIERAWEQAAAAGVEGSAEVRSATAHRDALAAQRELLDGLSRSGMLGDTAKSEIEAAHAAVAAASSHGRGHEEAVAAEDVALSRYGFDSYLDFTIATSTRSVGQKAQGKLKSVTDELAGAESALGTAREAAAARLEHLAQQREPVRAQIADFLGFRPDGPAEPHLLAIPAVDGPVTALLPELDDALQTAQEEVLRYGEVLQELTDERGALGTRRQELATQRQHIDRRIQEIEGLLAQADPEVAASALRVEEAEAAGREAEAALAAAWRACEELDDATADTYTTEDLPAVVDGLMSRLDPWAPDPLPVVLHDTLAPLGPDGAAAVLGALFDGASRSQIIYITEDRSLLGWAQGLGPDRAGVVELHRPRWLQRRLGRRTAGRFRS